MNRSMALFCLLRLQTTGFFLGITNNLGFCRIEPSSKQIISTSSKIQHLVFNELFNRSCSMFAFRIPKI